MQTCLLFIGMAWCLVWNSSAQPCKQITIDDVVQKKILSDYIDDAVTKRAFVGDKGVVVVTRFLNEEGRPSWLIHTTIDDTYKDNPPAEWARLKGDIVLFYDTHSSRFDVVKHIPTPELLRCLEDAIGDRLYIRPPKRERLLDSGLKTKAGKPIIVNARRLYGGNVDNSLIIVFEANGTITKLQPV